VVRQIKSAGNDRDQRARQLHHRPPRLAPALGNTASTAQYSPAQRVTAPHTTPSAIPVVCRRLAATSSSTANRGAHQQSYPRYLASGSRCAPAEDRCRPPPSPPRSSGLPPADDGTLEMAEHQYNPAKATPPPEFAAVSAYTAEQRAMVNHGNFASHAEKGSAQPSLRFQREIGRGKPMI